MNYLWDILKANALPDGLSMQDYFIVNRNIYNFQPSFRQIFASFSCWFYDHFLDWNHGKQICFLWETQKYVKYWIMFELLQYIWNISNFQQFLGKFLPHSLQLLVLWPLVCLKSWNPDVFLGKHKNMLKYWILFELLHFIKEY